MPYGNEGRWNSRGSSQTNWKKRLYPSWMRGVRGCVACGEDHLAQQRHGGEEVSKAMKRLKAKHPTYLFTVDHLATIHQMDQSEETEGNDRDLGDHVEWVKKEEHAVIFFAPSEGKNIEQHFPISTFLHERGDCCNKVFDGLRTDTCANETSVISECQYQSYCHTCYLACIRPSRNRVTKGIGGSTTFLGIVVIHVPLN